MTTTRQAGKAIVIGYQWTLGIEFQGIEFDYDDTFTGQVRCSITSDNVLYEMTTANGGITVTSTTTLALAIPAEITDLLEEGSVYMDIVRTSEAPDQYLGFILQVPVILPVTRGL